MTAPTVPAARTAQALRARQQKTDAALARITEALEQMAKTRTPVTVAHVARTAHVSRTFLYEHPGARAMVSEAASRAAGRRVQDRQDEQDAIEASWRERALNTESALKSAHSEILAQREQIADLLGQIRDLQTEWTKDDIARIITENGTLKKRVRELTAEGKSVTSKLSAARDNIRFMDKRLADLEARVVQQDQVADLASNSPSL